jgi:predicted esterase
MSRSSHPSPFVVQPTHKHTQTFILLHGLGSNGEQFGVEFLETGINSHAQKLTDVFPGARFIFPTAKKRRSSAFGRATITQWFDIASLDDPSFKRETQYNGLADSTEHLLKIIKAELGLIQPGQIILGGLSHGCAMALSLMLGLDVALGGVVGMSGWLPFQRDIADLLCSHLDLYNESEEFFDTGERGEESNRDAVEDILVLQREILSIECKDTDKIKTCLSTPVFIGHGQADEKVKVSLGDDIVRTLQSLGMNVTWKKYQDQGHWYKIPDEIDDIIQFIEAETSLGAVTE